MQIARVSEACTRKRRGTHTGSPGIALGRRRGRTCRNRDSGGPLARRSGAGSRALSGSAPRRRAGSVRSAARELDREPSVRDGVIDRFGQLSQVSSSPLHGGKTELAATRWQPAAVDPCQRARDKVFRGTVVWTALFAASTMGGSQARRLIRAVVLPGLARNGQTRP